MKQSRLAGLFVVLGTCTGTVIWSIAEYFGISYLFIAVPWIYMILKVLGGSYIIYLGTFVDNKIIEIKVQAGCPTGKYPKQFFKLADRTNNKSFQPENRHVYYQFICICFAQRAYYNAWHINCYFNGWYLPDMVLTRRFNIFAQQIQCPL